MLEQFDCAISFDYAKSAILVADRAKLPVFGEGKASRARHILPLKQFLELLFAPVDFYQSLGC